MEYRLRKILPGEFFKNVVVVAGGNTIAQVINIMASPFITRLYGADAFGLLNIFIAIVAVFISVSTLSYSQAIVIPKKNIDAYQLLVISLALSLIISALFFLLLPFLSVLVMEEYNIYGLSPFFELIPVAIFIMAGVYCLDQWLVREKKFKQLSVAIICQSTFSAGSRILLGLQMTSPGILIKTGIASQLIQLILLGYFSINNLKKARKFHVFLTPKKNTISVIKVAKRYRDFPIYRSPQMLLNTLSSSLPVIVLGILFDVKYSGFYGLAHSVLQLPVILISQSIGKVFLQKISVYYGNKNPIYPLIVKTTGILTIIGFFLFGVIILVAPWLFEVIFGGEWRQAGIFAQWLSILVFFRFINIPSVQSLALTNSQHILLLWEVITTLMKTMILFSSAYFDVGVNFTIAAYSIFGAVAYLVLIIIGLKRAKKNDCFIKTS